MKLFKQIVKEVYSKSIRLGHTKYSRDGGRLDKI